MRDFTKGVLGVIGLGVFTAEAYVLGRKHQAKHDCDVIDMLSKGISIGADLKKKGGEKAKQDETE